MIPLRVTATAAAIVSLFLIAVCVPACADDTAVSVAAGGIQLRKEARISMDKERLTITLDKVTVDFWFRNETNKDVTTEVAFPVPPYQFDLNSTNGPHDFADFKLRVDGQPVSYQTDVHAMLNGKDHTSLLRGLGIDIATFGKYDWKGVPPEISKLSSSDQARLIRLGLLDNSDDAFPQWTVNKMYYWRQTFPVGTLIHIRHVYKPLIGAEAFQPEEIQKQLNNTCMSDELYRSLQTAAAESLKRSHGLNGGDVYAAWVNYILTTANTWRTPIKDFELIVDVASTSKTSSSYPHVSFCSDGPIDKLSPSRWVVRRRDYIPRHELAVYFFGVPES